MIIANILVSPANPLFRYEARHALAPINSDEQAAKGLDPASHHFVMG
jgi:hypothetical protein